MDRRPIGIFDSGLGGLTVLRELRRALPHENFIYLGDAARAPYGSKGEETIRRYADECASFLLAKEIKYLVVACNTVSSVALGELERRAACPVIGTIEPAVSAALEISTSRQIAVLGTRATIGNGSYERAIIARAPQVSVHSVACPLFVPLVEEGILKGAMIEAALDLYLAHLKRHEVDTVILGCTHYPMLREALGSFFGPQVRLVECSQAIAQRLRQEIGGGAGVSGGRGSEQYFVTDEVSRFNTLGALFLESGKLEAMHVEDLSRRG